MTDTDYTDRCRELSARFYNHAQSAVKEGNITAAIYMSRKARVLHLEAESAADADEWGEVAPVDWTR